LRDFRRTCRFADRKPERRDERLALAGWLDKLRSPMTRAAFLAERAPRSCGAGAWSVDARRAPAIGYRQQVA
jgi:hypothetical protein